MNKKSIMVEFFKLLKFDNKNIADYNKLVDDYNELLKSSKKLLKNNKKWRKAEKEKLYKYYENLFEEFKDEFTDSFSDFVDVIFREIEQEEIEQKDVIVDTICQELIKGNSKLISSMKTMINI